MKSLTILILACRSILNSATALDSFTSITSLPYTVPDLLALEPTERSTDTEHSLCELPLGSGLSNGICADPEELTGKISFCAEFVDYPTCIPPKQPLWSSWDVTAKDALLAAQYESAVRTRIDLEMKSIEDSVNGTVVGEEFVPVRFTSNQDCQLAFKRALCWANFPKCNKDGFPSFPVCKSACKNYFKACRFNSDAVCASNNMWPLPISDSAVGSTGDSSSLGAGETPVLCTGGCSGVTLGMIVILVVLIAIVS